METNLYLMDISYAKNTSGVDRYMQILADGLKHHPHIRVVWIQLRKDTKLVFPSEESCAHYTKVTIPLPQEFDVIVAERFWIRKYNEQVFRLTKHLFDHRKNSIIHLHTLNLIDLAVYIREQVGCKIITHLHCIPWKGWYEVNKNQFNALYKKIYFPDNDEKPDPGMFLTNNCESQAYTAPDAVIGVTRCGIRFLTETIRTVTPHTFVVPNGIDDFNNAPAPRADKKPDETFNCLFVGVVNESKGIFYILNALRLVQQKGYRVSLSVAGNCASEISTLIRQEYSDLNVTLLGRIPFDELKKQYLTSDIGLIGSVHEQASYVGVEMAMFGLPLVTTAVDGLDEMFTDEENALKVDALFSPVFGFSIDEEKMAAQVIRLMENPGLRTKLSQNIRTLYQAEFNLNKMIEKTVHVYERVIANQTVRVDR